MLYHFTIHHGSDALGDFVARIAVEATGPLDAAAAAEDATGDGEVAVPANGESDVPRRQIGKRRPA